MYVSQMIYGGCFETSVSHMLIYMYILLDFAEVVMF